MKKTTKKKTTKKVVKKSTETLLSGKGSNPTYPTHEYSASIKSMGVTESVVGTSISDVIEKISNLRIKKGVAVLTISHGLANKERVLNRIQIMRLFNHNPGVKQMAILQISSLYNL